MACALTAVSSLAGMRYTDELDGITPNILSFCIAGSGTGKEQIMQCYLNIAKAAGVQSAIHGGFKSEQEVIRNLIRHQAAFYCIDDWLSPFDHSQVHSFRPIPSSYTPIG